MVLKKDPSKSLFFSEVHAECAEPAWDFLGRMGVASSDLQDRHQETFLTVHKRLADYDPAWSLVNWVLGIARKKASHYRRDKNLQPLWMPDFESHAELLASEEPGPETELLHDEQRRMLTRMLEDLPQDARDVFLMAEIDGATYLEIAKLLELTPRAVKSRHLEARTLMAAALARYAASEQQGRPRRPLPLPLPPEETP